MGGKLDLFLCTVQILDVARPSNGRSSYCTFILVFHYIFFTQCKLLSILFETHNCSVILRRQRRRRKNTDDHHISNLWDYCYDYTPYKDHVLLCS
jgi:hypothetical protein